MLESVIERYCVNLCKKHGIVCRKLQWVGRRSAPDRWVGGVFVEFKSTTGKLADHQEREIKRLRLYSDVRVINSKEQVDELIDEILSKGKPGRDNRGD